jgi:hypothetical protein
MTNDEFDIVKELRETPPGETISVESALLHAAADEIERLHGQLAADKVNRPTISYGPFILNGEIVLDEWPVFLAGCCIGFVGLRRSADDRPPYWIAYGVGWDDFVSTDRCRDSVAALLPDGTSTTHVIWADDPAMA